MGGPRGNEPVGRSGSDIAARSSASPPADGSPTVWDEIAAAQAGQRAQRFARAQHFVRHSKALRVFLLMQAAFLGWLASGFFIAIPNDCSETAQTAAQCAESNDISRAFFVMGVVVLWVLTNVTFIAGYVAYRLTDGFARLLPPYS